MTTRGGREHKLPVPSKSEVEGLTKAEIAEKFDVSPTTAANWQSEHELYDAERESAGLSSPIGQQLVDMDPEDLGLGDQDEGGAAP